MMDIRFEHSAAETAKMTTGALRAAFLTGCLMVDDEIQLCYSHYDRMITGGARPVQRRLHLEPPAELRATGFLERRELGVINVGGSGQVCAGNDCFSLERLDGLYLGRGLPEVTFQSDDASDPACFYLLSAPAHQSYPSRKVTRAEAQPTETGSSETANARTIYKYIHDQGPQSCQLVMGLTILRNGSVWNTMPAHTHTRRTEVYYYFNLEPDQRVFHFMGAPQETRHLVVANHQAVISPPWSIHAGCGTSHYGFIWGMAGENYTYTDMDVVQTGDLL